MKVGAFFIDKNGNLIGEKDTSKLDNANWYQKIFARISKKYRSKLVVLAPIDTGLKTNHQIKGGI